MNLLDFSREPITSRHHIAAAVIGIVSAIVYALVVNDGRFSFLKSALAGFWTACAYYSYAFAANVRYRELQSVPVTFVGIIVGALILIYGL